MKKNFTVLAVDTSCDETSAAVTCNDRVLANIVSSQVEIHQKYGGVVPNLARQAHEQLIGPVIDEALKRAGKNFGTIDAVAVTVGPGLAPALEVGIDQAKNIAKKYQLPFIAVNHMEAHLLSSFAKNNKGNGPFSQTPPQFPILGLLVSGGHTQLVLMKDFGRYLLLGETVDDAAGEAFDKVAKMLGLGYPGGPIISELAKSGKPKYQLPIPMADSANLNFSFSGLKTACLYKIQKSELTKKFILDFCASFESAVAKALTVKLEKAIAIHQPKQIILGGGVVSNLTIRKEVRKVAQKFKVSVFIPYNKKLLTDNAAIVGVCAYYQAERNDFAENVDVVDRQPNLNFR